MHDADTNAYVVAVDRRRVGIAVAAGSGFRFIAADPEFRPLDGSSFRRLAQLEQAAARLARTVTGPAATHLPASTVHAGVSEDHVNLSVGIVHVDDVLADLDRTLTEAHRVRLLAAE